MIEKARGARNGSALTGRPASSFVASSLMLIGALLLLVGPMVPARAQGAFTNHTLLQSGPVVSIDPPSAEIDVGDTVAVDVYLEDVTDLAYVEMYVIFDPDFLEVVDADTYTDGVQIEIGPLFGADVIVTYNEVDQSAGEIFFAQEIVTDTVSGSGVLATITFQGNAAGTSDIVIDGDGIYLADGDGEFISAGIEDGSIAVIGDVTPSPTPTRTPTPGATLTPASTSLPTSTSAPTSPPTPQPTATPAIQSRVLQLWPDRSVGVTSGLLEGAASHADTQVFPFGTFSPSPGETIQARTYLHFPIDALPLGTEVKQATLYVYVDSVSGLGEAAFGAYRVLAPWGETGWGSAPSTWPSLLSSPIAITEVSFGEGEAALPAAPPVPKRAFIMAQDSPLQTPTAPSSVLPTSTLPTSSATPTSTPTRTPGPTGTPAPGSTPTTLPSAPAPTSPASGGSVGLEPIEGRWLMWDVTALLRAWLAEEVVDYGLALAAASDSAGPDSAGDLLLARWLTVDDPNTMPYIVADILIHPVTPTPTPIPILPIAGGAGGWGGTLVLLAGAALLVLGLALAVRRASLDQ
ncbi:MAG: hypothetical protein JW918_04050 [Anaerolineae bacterium]|nr:hypothetical protein [Anaerolineae bacterium]